MEKPVCASLFAALAEKKLIPVIKITDPDTAAPLADALSRGGLPIAEVTFRTECAAASISAMKTSHPDMYVGAGTVLSVAQVDEALAAGADFIVAPGFDPAVVQHALSLGVPVIPGCVTPSEISAAISLGLSVLKFFPASVYGGAGAIKALSAPFSGVRFIPTGGIDLSNLHEYTALPSVLAIGGSFMAPEKLLAAHDWGGIVSLTRKALDATAGITRI